MGNVEYLVYFLGDEKENRYVHQLFYDINKVLDYDNIILLTTNLEKLIKEWEYLNFKKEHTYLILDTKENIELIKQIADVDYYELIKYIYDDDSQILYSDWKVADYYLGKNQYVLVMPFIDAEKVNELKWYYEENLETKKEISIKYIK